MPAGEARSWQDDFAAFSGGVERAFLVGAETEDGAWTAEDSLQELADLCRTLGLEVVGRTIARRRRREPAFRVGQGKRAEVRLQSEELRAGLVVVDAELTGSHQRDLQQDLGVRVLDRTQIILDIFAWRARTREGKLQVEVARLNYLLPRLAGRWPELSRLGGGIGTRGPGETRLETERRRLRRRLGDLRRDLEEVRQHRELLRTNRKQVPFPLLALVGYTNAGKSTLFNALTRAEVLVEDRLFATLDPTTRALILPNHQQVLLTDTVGFIQRLPTQLVAAFRATLEELVEADLLVHVIDGSHPRWPEQAATVDAVLKELGAGDLPVLSVLNKLDRMAEDTVPHPQAGERSTLTISALHGWNLDRLLDQIARALAATRCRISLAVPYQHGNLLQLLRAKGQVLSEEYGEHGVTVEVEIERTWADRIRHRLETGSA
ncbi:MAG TPA: GTPase HflX [Clostridiales bacterium]|nr:GTPase HflX [Clostridiales bacterium]